MRTVTVEIKSRWNEGVLFSAEVDAGISAHMRVRAITGDDRMKAFQGEGE